MRLRVRSIGVVSNVIVRKLAVSNGAVRNVAVSDWVCRNAPVSKVVAADGGELHGKLVASNRVELCGKVRDVDVDVDGL